MTAEEKIAVKLAPRHSAKTNVAAMLALAGNTAHNIDMSPTTQSTNPINDRAIAIVWQ